MGFVEDPEGSVVFAYITMKHSQLGITLDAGVFSGHKIAHSFHTHLVGTDRHGVMGTGPPTLGCRARIANHTGPVIAAFTQHGAIKCKNIGIAAR